MRVLVESEKYSAFAPESARVTSPLRATAFTESDLLVLESFIVSNANVEEGTDIFGEEGTIGITSCVGTLP